MTTDTIRTHDLDEIEASDMADTLCRICLTQLSKYTCPSCNILYCGLNCFRSEAHAQCSERFYKKEVEAGIKSVSPKMEGDRSKILELLHRIENQGVLDEMEPFRYAEEEHEEDDIAHRFSEIDISSASADDLLRLLTDKERHKFFSALKNPSGGLVQVLLESAELDKTKRRPWWEAPSDSGRSPVSSRIPYGVKPSILGAPFNLVNQASHGVSLLYNICVILLAYAYVTRHLYMSPLASTTNDSQDQNEARKIFSQSVPFLMDRQSRFRHTSLTDAVISFWSRFHPGNMDIKTMIILLGDLAKLMRPRRIIVAENSLKEADKTAVFAADHPFSTTIMAMSDLSLLFGAHVDSPPAACRKSHVVLKLNFYAAHILSTPPSKLHALADQVCLLAKGAGEKVDPSWLERYDE